MKRIRLSLRPAVVMMGNYSSTQRVWVHCGFPSINADS